MMSKKIRLAIDMDGVIVNILQPWLEKYNTETGENIQVEDIKEWDLFKTVKQPKILNKILLSKHFFSTPKPYLDVLDVFPKLLKDERFEVFVLTRVPRGSERGMFEKRMWLKNHFNFPQENFIAAHKKFMICADLLLDDQIENLRDFKKEDPKRLSVCFDHPYNQGAICDARVKSWKEFSLLLDKIWDTKRTVKQTKCNRHKDCSKKKQGSECCFSSTCEECFGY